MINTADPRGYTVTCDDETWNKHIVAGHTIMEYNDKAVKETIDNPDVIYRSSQSPIRNVYFAKPSSSTYGNLYTKVVVQINDTDKTGEIVSAWPQPSISGGIDQGGVLYVKPKL